MYLEKVTQLCLSDAGVVSGSSAAFKTLLSVIIIIIIPESSDGYEAIAEKISSLDVLGCVN